MSTGAEVDGVLVQWGERLFYPGNRIVRSAPPRLSGSVGRRAAAIRRHIRATVIYRAPQVMVKVTGGGRGMAAIAAHFRYISKNGRLDIEDERGETMRGKDSLHDLVDDWRLGGTLIDDIGDRREAFNIMLSMPRGTDPLTVQRAAREFARAELSDHRYVMVLHDHQANPHIHLSVRAESRHGKRLNPRKADLQRWRETFAEKLRGWGIDAEATRQRTRGQVRNYEPIWRIKAAEEERLRTPTPMAKSGKGIEQDRAIAAQAWERIADSLSRSTSPEDRALAEHVDRFLSDAFALEARRRLDVVPERKRNIEIIQPARVIARERDGPSIER